MMLMLVQACGLFETRVRVWESTVLRARCIVAFSCLAPLGELRPGHP